MHHGELENQDKMWQKLLDIGHKLHGVKLTKALRGLRQSDVKVSVEEDQHLVDKLETGRHHMGLENSCQHQFYHQPSNNFKI